jgi:hypothetical protein
MASPGAFILDPQSPTVTPPPASAPSSLWSRTENVLKTVTAGVGLVAAIGFPAVAVQLFRFGVPTAAYTYEQVLRAGILPAAVLVILAAYAVAGAKVVATSGWRRFFGLHSLLLLPLMVPAFIVLLLGVVAYLVLCLWALLWVVVQGAGFVAEVAVSNRTLLQISAIVLAVTGVLFLTALVLQKHVPVVGRLLGAFARSSDSNRRVQPPAQEAAPTSLATPRIEWFGLAMLLIAPLVYVYALWAVAYIWDPALTGAVRHLYLMSGALTIGALLDAFYIGTTQFARRGAGDAAPSSRRMLVGAVAIVYVIFEASYAAWWYPRLPAGFGGGKPSPITLWLKGDDPGGDIASALARITAAPSRGMTRVDGAYILSEAADRVILTNANEPPAEGIFISRSRIMGVSWGP